MDNILFKHNGKSIPIILGAGINGLGVVRSFGEDGLSSIIIEQDRDIAFYSKYCVGIKCPDPIKKINQFLTFMIKIGSQFQQKGFLIPTSDKFLIIMCRYKNILEKFYHYPISNWNIIENLINKENLFELAQKSGIDTPMTYRISHILDIIPLMKNVPFPIILKPTITVGFIQTFGQKVIIINSSDELDEIVAKISGTDFSDKHFVVQEYIPGNVNNLYTITSYSNRSYDIIGYSTGYKIRQDPPFAGTITSGRIDDDSKILTISKRLIKAAKFYGISNIEYKKDERDGCFKLMEINPRSGVWNYSAKASGINLPLLMYNDYFENSVCLECDKKEITWISLIDDLSLALWGFKKMGYPEESLSFWQWYSSIRGKKSYAIFNSCDIRPFIKQILLKFRRKFVHNTTNHD